MSQTKDSSISFGLGLLAGVVGGVVAGILYSPKSGEEMRNEIKQTIGIPEKEPKLVYTHIASIKLINKVKYALEKQIARANDAIKAARLATAKRKEEIESEYNY